jgi:hypothetical protein
MKLISARFATTGSTAIHDLLRQSENVDWCPNESGKSTFIEAVHRALFSRPR